MKIELSTLNAFISLLDTKKPIPFLIEGKRFTITCEQLYSVAEWAAQNRGTTYPVFCSYILVSVEGDKLQVEHLKIRKGGRKRIKIDIIIEE